MNLTCVMMLNSHSKPKNNLIPLCMWLRCFEILTDIFPAISLYPLSFSHGSRIDSQTHRMIATKESRRKRLLILKNTLFSFSKVNSFRELELQESCVSDSHVEPWEERRVQTAPGYVQGDKP